MSRKNSEKISKTAVRNSEEDNSKCKMQNVNLLIKWLITNLLGVLGELAITQV